MLKLSGWAWMGALAMMLLAGTAVADTRAAADAYKKGQALQAAKQYGPAISQYQQALKHDPKYAWAYKGMGTSYYSAGDKASALKCYDIYVKANPVDTATKDFADKIRAEIAAGGGKAPSGKKPGLQSGLSLGAGFGILMASAGDLNKPNAGCATCKSYTDGMALSQDLALDYAFGGFVLGASLMNGPARTHSVDYGNGFKGTAIINNLGLWLNPGYRILLGKSFWIQPGLGIGYMMSTMTQTFSGPGVSGGGVIPVYTGSGLGFWPQVNFTKMFGRKFGGSLGLGYLISGYAVKDDKGKEVTYTTSTGAKETYSVNTGGLSLRLGLTYHFSAPIE